MTPHLHQRARQNLGEVFQIDAALVGSKIMAGAGVSHRLHYVATSESSPSESAVFNGAAAHIFEQRNRRFYGRPMPSGGCRAGGRPPAPRRFTRQDRLHHRLVLPQQHRLAPQ